MCHVSICSVQNVRGKPYIHASHGWVAKMDGRVLLKSSPLRQIDGLRHESELNLKAQGNKEEGKREKRKKERQKMVSPHRYPPAM